MAERQPTVHLIHGINVSDPMGNIGKLKPCFEEVGFKNVVVEDYGFLPFGLAWARNKSIARKLLKKMTPGDIVVAHSNGAAITYHLLEMGAQFSGVVLLNPALNHDLALTQGVEWVHVYFNENDHVVWLAKWIPAHIWGDQGRRGYTGNDPRYKNINTSKLAGALAGEEHSDYWADDKFPAWCPFMTRETWNAYVAHRRT